MPRTTTDIIEALRMLQQMHASLARGTNGTEQTVHIAAVEVLNDTATRLENAATFDGKIFEPSDIRTNPEAKAFRAGALRAREAISTGDIDDLVEGFKMGIYDTPIVETNHTPPVVSTPRETYESVAWELINQVTGGKGFSKNHIAEWLRRADNVLENYVLTESTRKVLLDARAEVLEMRDRLGG